VPQVFKQKEKPHADYILKRIHRVQMLRKMLSVPNVMGHRQDQFISNRDGGQERTMKLSRYRT
jgi:hypothetical protein